MDEQQALKILILENKDKQNTLTYRLLKSKLPKAKLYRANNCSDAHLLLPSSLPDMVMMDLDLPLKDLYSISHVIKVDKRLRATKIMAYSDWDTIEIRQKISFLGLDSYIQAPFDVNELISRIRTLIPHLEEQQ